jgi:hypothetical protein
MAYRNKILFVSNRWRLVRSVRAKSSIKYLIVNTGWPNANLAEMEQLFDPIGNRKVSSMAYTWKFNTRNEAEQLLAIAVLKGW